VLCGAIVLIERFFKALDKTIVLVPVHQGREEMVVVPRLRSTTNCVAANYDRATDSASVVQSKHNESEQWQSGNYRSRHPVCLTISLRKSRDLGGKMRAT
jgi:hypothetical protein